MSVSIYYVTSEFLRRGRITYDDITRYLAEESENPSERPLIFDLMVDDFRIKEANFHTFTWEKTATEKRYGESVKAFTKQPATYETTLMLQGSEQYRKDILNKLHNAIEADVINGSPGRIYWESYFIDCYIISSETSPAEGQSPFVTENKLSIYCPYPFWTKLIDTDYHGEHEGEETQEDIESVMDFMTIGVLPNTRSERFYVLEELVTRRGDIGQSWAPQHEYWVPSLYPIYAYCTFNFSAREDGLWNYDGYGYYLPEDGSGRDTIDGVMSTEQINANLLWRYYTATGEHSLMNRVYTEDLDRWSVNGAVIGSNGEPITLRISKDNLNISIPVSDMVYRYPSSQSAEAGIFGPAGTADFAFDFLADLGRFSQVVNDSAYACNWEMVINGPVTAPAITINDTIIGIEQASVPEGASLRINSRDKTILLVYSNGETVNYFGYRVKTDGNYVFEKIPSGTFTVTVNDTFSWSLTLFDERSEPRWSI